MTVDEGLSAIKEILGSDLFPTAIPGVRDVLEKVQDVIDEDAELPVNRYNEDGWAAERAAANGYLEGQQSMLAAGFRKVRTE